MYNIPCAVFNLLTRDTLRLIPRFTLPPIFRQYFATLPHPAQSVFIHYNPTIAAP